MQSILLEITTRWSISEPYVYALLLHAGKLIHLWWRQTQSSFSSMVPQKRGGFCFYGGCMETWSGLVDLHEAGQRSKTIKPFRRPSVHGQTVQKWGQFGAEGLKTSLDLETSPRPPVRAQTRTSWTSSRSSGEEGSCSPEMLKELVEVTAASAGPSIC